MTEQMWHDLGRAERDRVRHVEALERAAERLGELDRAGAVARDPRRVETSRDQLAVQRGHTEAVERIRDLQQQVRDQIERGEWTTPAAAEALEAAEAEAADTGSPEAELRALGLRRVGQLVQDVCGPGLDPVDQLDPTPELEPEPAPIADRGVYSLHDVWLTAKTNARRAAEAAAEAAAMGRPVDEVEQLRHERDRQQERERELGAQFDRAMREATPGGREITL